MKHKVSELTGALLDRAVAMAAGYTISGTIVRDTKTGEIVGNWDVHGWWPGEEWAPHRKWEDGGPIVDQDHISLTSPDMSLPPGDSWWAEMLGTLLTREQGGHDRSRASGPTALVAAMRAKVASRFGDEVDLPD